MLAHARVCGCSELCEMPDDDAICEVQYTQMITHAAPRYVPIHLASESIRRHACAATNLCRASLRRRYWQINKCVQSLHKSIRIYTRGYNTGR